MRGNDVVLTGIPRSGTTLTCHLLNKLPDTVALHEPIEWGKLADSQNHEAVGEQIGCFFTEMRASLNQNRTAFSQLSEGNVPDNPVGGYGGLFRWAPNRLLGWSGLGGIGLRRSKVARGVFTIDKALSNEFLLCIKHTGPFTSLLGTLRNQHRCYAIVRNPLSVLASWNSVPFAIREGRLYEAERFDQALSQELKRISDRFERQLHLLSWFFEQFDLLLPRANIVHYEEIVKTRGVALNAVTERASMFDEPLAPKNNNPLYNQRMKLALGKRLLKHEGPVWKFYSKACVEELMES